MNEVVLTLGNADCRAVSSLRWTRRLFLSRYRRITDLDDKVSIRDGITLRRAENEREGHVLFLRDDGRMGGITPETGNETERRMEEWKVCITQNPGLNHWLIFAVSCWMPGLSFCRILYGFADNLQGMYNHSVRTLTDGGVTLKIRRWHHS